VPTIAGKVMAFVQVNTTKHGTGVVLMLAIHQEELVTTRPKAERRPDNDGKTKPSRTTLLFPKKCWQR
jgi:hypothetical protein